MRPSAMAFFRDGRGFCAASVFFVCPEFSLETERQYLPDEGCDGFYIAKLVRKAAL